MKSLAFVAVLFASHTAFAKDCVSTSQRTNSFEPKTICIEQIQSNADGLTAQVKGTPFSGEFESLGEIDGVDVLVARVVDEPDEVGCGYHMVQTLTLWVKTVVQPGEKRLTKALFGYEYTPDTCHSPVVRNLLQYE